MDGGLWHCIGGSDQNHSQESEVIQSCPTLCHPTDGSPRGSPIPGVLQARILDWVAISFSNAWKWKVKVKSLSCVRLLATWWTTAYQSPPSMEFSRHEYWSGVPFPRKGNTIKAKCLSEQALKTAEKRREAKGKGKKERYTRLIA